MIVIRALSSTDVLSVVPHPASRPRGLTDPVRRPRIEEFSFQFTRIVLTLSRSCSSTFCFCGTPTQTGTYREACEVWRDIPRYFRDQWNVLDALGLLFLLVGLVIRWVDSANSWGPAFYALSAPLLVSRVLFFAQILPFQGPMIQASFMILTIVQPIQCLRRFGASRGGGIPLVLGIVRDSRPSAIAHVRVSL